MNITAEQITHLTEHIDQFVALTGAEDVEFYFASHPEASYASFCEVMDIEPIEDKAEAKAAEAFGDMSARDHRKAAEHLLTCPADGLLNALGFLPVPIPDKDIFLASVAGALMGKPTGGMQASKVENLQNAKTAIVKMRAMLDDADKHLSAAIQQYSADV